MKRQETDWGYIDWLEDENSEKRTALQAGIVTIAPHGHMEAHIHFTEQVLYTLQGEGYSILNGEKLDMSEKKEFFHWEAGAIHEMYNTGDTEFKHLMISCPDAVHFQMPAFEEDQVMQMHRETAEEYLFAAIDGTRKQFLDTLKYSYVIFDRMGKPVKQTPIFPEFCCKHCLEKISTSRADCMCHLISCPFSETGSFECPYGATVFYVPLIFRGVFLGYVQGGYMHRHPIPDESVYIMPYSSVDAAKILLGRIAKAMTDYCEIYRSRKQLTEQENTLFETLQYQEVLTAHLRNAENTMTDLKINNHFLFNTLNQMASMALAGGLPSLYQSILDLSCLFSYAVRNNGSQVPLFKEFEYLQAYLELQKLRYKDRLQVISKVETDLHRWMVPFNFLMPLAENAFTHGFFQEDDKRLLTEIRENKGVLCITMSNNGIPVDQNKCRKIERDMKNTSAAHGLSMVFRKLQSAYGERFLMKLSPGKENGLCVEIRIPAVKISRKEVNHNE